jgi:hypothetical protein
MASLNVAQFRKHGRSWTLTMQFVTGGVDRFKGCADSIRFGLFNILINKWRGQA